MISESPILTLASPQKHRTPRHRVVARRYDNDFRVSYTRDALGRIESENEIVEGVSALWAYRYDEAGRLVEVLKDGASYSVYRYDSNGNRLEAATQSGLVAGTYDAQDRLLTYGNFSYEYTANGELKTKTDTVTGAVTRYAYDVFGNLTRVDLPDSRVIEYVIDGANRRVGKKIVTGQLKTGHAGSLHNRPVITKRF